MEPHPRELRTATRGASNSQCPSRERRKGFEPATRSLGSWSRAFETSPRVLAVPSLHGETAPVASQTLPAVRSEVHSTNAFSLLFPGTIVDLLLEGGLVA